MSSADTIWRISIKTSNIFTQSIEATTNSNIILPLSQKQITVHYLTIDKLTKILQFDFFITSNRLVYIIILQQKENCSCNYTSKIHLFTYRFLFCNIIVTHIAKLVNDFLKQILYFSKGVVIIIVYCAYSSIFGA